MNDWAQLAVTLTIGLLTVSGSYAAVRVSRKTARTQETDVVTEAALSLVEPLKLRITELEEHVARLEDKLDKADKERTQLHRWALTLTGQLHGAGIEPISFEQIRYLDGIEGGI